MSLRDLRTHLKLNLPMETPLSAMPEDTTPAWAQAKIAAKQAEWDREQRREDRKQQKQIEKDKAEGKY